MKTARLVLAGVLALATTGCADLTTTGVPADGQTQAGTGSPPASDGHSTATPSASAPTPEGSPSGATTDPEVAEATKVAETLVGMTDEQAKAAAEQAGLSYRVIAEDGQSKPATTDYRPDRINVEIEDGTVTKATVG